MGLSLEVNISEFYFLRTINLEEALQFIYPGIKPNYWYIVKENMVQL